jgi:hypothetical protein
MVNPAGIQQHESVGTMDIGPRQTVKATCLPCNASPVLVKRRRADQQQLTDIRAVILRRAARETCSAPTQSVDPALRGQLFRAPPEIRTAH